MEYKVIVEGSTEMLMHSVNLAISEGWKPYGGVAVGSGAIYQAMIKESKDWRKQIDRGPR